MLRSAGPLLANSIRRGTIRYITSTTTSLSHHPNAPVELDPSFQALLKDVDMSIRHRRPPTLDSPGSPSTHRELEVYPNDPSEEGFLSSEELDLEDDGGVSARERKSPAADFGSQRIGATVLPFELEQTIAQIIAESDKFQLHADAKRLFLDQTGTEPDWDTSYSVRYPSRQKEAQNAQRDGTAFASIALPAHYSAIRAVVEHVKQRLGPTWNVERVIDWGSGAGSGLWAASYAFQKASSSDHADPQIANTSITSYIGIEKRIGLTTIAKRLIEGIELGSLVPSWQKAFNEEDHQERSEGSGTVALSAFHISSLSSPLARKTLVKEMWESGAEVLILIDHNTKAGFESIAAARDALLRYGRKEFDDESMPDVPLKGCHVVAPCPHDGACPLYHPGSIHLLCGFSQRLQRPTFIRKTKHSGIGHEDTEYSYIVIRRGPRPTPPSTKVGRIGAVARREIEKARAKRSMPELFLDDRNPVPIIHINNEQKTNESTEQSTEEDTDASLSAEEMQAALRAEAYSWPRLIFPPLKKSSHIVIDGCTSEAKIMRMTIPRSQGKQPFYDARKSAWGDIFPHHPKNRMQERYQPKRAGDSKTVPLKGGDIGKKGAVDDRKRGKKGSNLKTSYEVLAGNIKEQRREVEQRRRRRREKFSEEDSDDDFID